MSKDLVIAGIIVVVCIAITAVMLVPPSGNRTAPPPVAVADTRHNNGPTPPDYGDSFGGGTTGGSSRTPDHVFNPVPMPPVVMDPTPPRLMPSPPPPIFAEPVDTMPLPVVTDQTTTHEVKSGEILGDISLAHYGSSRHWKVIKDANPGLDEKNLHAGQKLIIPPLAKPAPVVAEVGDQTPAAPGNYKIKKGDSFYVIAKNELGDASRYEEIAKLNPGVDSEDLKVGQTIKLPTKGVKPATARTPSEAVAVIDDASVHVVKSGDTLQTISQQHYGTTKRWTELQKANPGVDPEGLKVGQKIKLPNLPAVVPGTGLGAAIAPADPNMTEYTVKADDRLEDIAKHFYGDANAWKKIQAANKGLDPKALRIGQKLRIPLDHAPATGPLPAALPTRDLAPVPNPNRPVSPAQPAPAPAPLPPWLQGIGDPSTGANDAGGASPSGSTAPASNPMSAFNIP